MNKNYKHNLKTRYKDEGKEKKVEKRIDFKEFHVPHETELLLFLIEDLHYTRTNAKALLAHHLISINGAPVSQFNFKLYKDDSVILTKRPIKKKARKDIPVIFENREFIVINKPYGLLSIASQTEKSSTAYRMVMDFLQSRDKHDRIFVTHRIDRETSGVLLFCKDEKLRDEIQKNWNDIVIKRGYYAVVEGVMEKQEDTIVNYIAKNRENIMYLVKPNTKDAQKCITKYKVIKGNGHYTLLDIEIMTGRKNQIRVTLGALGHYVVGDDKYGEPSNPLNRMCLHSYELTFKHPTTGKVYKFIAPMPKEFLTLVN